MRVDRQPIYIWFAAAAKRPPRNPRLATGQRLQLWTQRGIRNHGRLRYTLRYEDAHFLRKVAAWAAPAAGAPTSGRSTFIDYIAGVA